MYDAINTSATGMTAHRAWIDMLADNIANVNTVKPTSEAAFQATFAQASEIGPGADGIGTGTRIVSKGYSDPDGVISYEPDNPLADDEGYVRRPDIDLSQQMGDLMLAQRAFQANANALERSKAMYEAAIQIGKGI